MTVVRCAWPRTPLDVEYHDREWGVPVHNDRVLFEFLTLEGAQAGLSWSTILKKRQNCRKAFENLEVWLVRRVFWQFVGGTPRIDRRRSLADIPSRTPESDALSKDLLARGFRFVGSTICYAFMQAVGMVNDHTIDCFRHAELS